MLGDAFMNVRKEAGGTIPALKIFASSLFTFAGIFPLVLMGLIAYSKEIMAFGKNLFESSASLLTFKERFNSMNEAFKSIDYQNAIQNVNELRISINLAQKGIGDKDAVVKLYNETIGKTTFLTLKRNNPIWTPI